MSKDISYSNYEGVAQSGRAEVGNTLNITSCRWFESALPHRMLIRLRYGPLSKEIGVPWPCEQRITLNSFNMKKVLYYSPLWLAVILALSLIFWIKFVQLEAPKEAPTAPEIELWQTCTDMVFDSLRFWGDPKTSRKEINRIQLSKYAVAFQLEKYETMQLIQGEWRKDTFLYYQDEWQHDTLVRRELDPKIHNGLILYPDSVVTFYDNQFATFYAKHTPEKDN